MRAFHLFDVIPIAAGLALFLLALTSSSWAPWLYRLIMSRRSQRPVNAAGMDRYDIPVCATDTEAHTTPPASTGMEPDRADIDAANDGWEAPRVSAYGSVEEDIIYLSMRRAGPGQKHRYSANKIAQMVGGDRNAVMALVKKVRSTDPLPIFYDDLLQRIEAEQA
jgi:hypothetical protein